MTSSITSMINDLSHRYIVLVLSVGHHDPDYVDAFFGPVHFREEADRRSLTLEQIETEAREALAELPSFTPVDKNSLEWLRHRYLTCQCASLVSRVEILRGKTLSFDEESRALYDAAAPTHPESYFQSLLFELEGLIPGKGPVHERLDAYRNAFVIPPARLDTVFRTAVDESKKRALKHVALPEGESFILEYVNGKSWSGYNWFKGGCASLIQINTDYPITIDRAIDLASHEGYPGHHVYNSLLETRLLRSHGWQEFSVYALFSPQSLIAEGTANYGIEMAFPGRERVIFERDVLFPLAGLNAQRAEEYASFFALTQKLSYAGNEAARRYLDGSFTREQAAEWLQVYALMPAGRARQRTKFFDQYRSYVINYNLGQDIVKGYIERGENSGEQSRWERFVELLSTPRVPSDLIGKG